jgi:hypothetical protein
MNTARIQIYLDDQLVVTYVTTIHIVKHILIRISDDVKLDL